MRTFKNFVFALVLPFGALLLNGAIPQTAQAMVIDVNAGLGPTVSTSGFTSNGAAYFSGLPYNNDINLLPAGYGPFVNEINPQDIVSTKGYSPQYFSWRGLLNPTGAFAGMEGTELYMIGTTLTSDTNISLDHVTVTIVSEPNPILNLTVFYGDGFHDYSGDWVVGATNPLGFSDVTANAPASTPVKQIRFILGPGNAVAPVNLPKTQATLDATSDYIAANIHTITFTVSYDHGGGNMESTSTIVRVVPEPASLVLFGLGSVLIANRYRRHA